MRTLVHISDLHFGRVDQATTQPLVRQTKEIQPHLLVVSGDLTQRARPWQFKEARAFLDSLPKPQIVVPGNHDVPAYNLLKRFFEPLKKFHRYITPERLPSYVDDEIAVFGMNSTLSLTTKYGRLRERDIAAVCENLIHVPKGRMKIVVCHHPFDLPANHTPRDLIGGSSSAMQAFAACGVDLILSGHLHLSHTSLTAERYRIPGHSALIVQAGTAISNRGRGELNSFNVLKISQEKLTVERLTWNAASSSYTLLKTERFTRTATGWTADQP
jgi:3',5'-cyclic AMP phosphodiesterase CpdA